ncbi:hypothetical protein GCM10027073_69330 [Streptomyces chlorus]
MTDVCPGIVDTGITSSARFTGADAEEKQRRRQRAARLYGLRNYPPKKVRRRSPPRFCTRWCGTMQWHR